MLNVYVDQSPQYIHDYVFRVCDYLGINGYDADLVVTPKREMEADIVGECYGFRDRVDIEYLSCKLPRSEKLITIAHEMVHARQILSGEHIRLNNRWHGSEYVGFDQEEFYPWEEEAYRLERIIYEECR